MFVLLAGLIVLLAGASIARLHRKASAPAAAQDSQQDVRSPGGTSPEAAALETPAGKHGETESQQALDRITGPAQASKARTKAPKKDLQSYSFPVIHNHVLGSCKGTLQSSEDSLSFISEKVKDSFTLTYAEFSCAVSSDTLTIRSGAKTYRFKSAVALTKDENQSQLQNIHQRISGNQRLKTESSK